MIETNDVTISPVSVTIKVLKVNNRQMTKAVFTQLPKLSELICQHDENDETLNEYTLTGNVWGWVNYCPRGEEPNERQFVVESDGKLYRAACRVERVELTEPSTHDRVTDKLISALLWKLFEIVAYLMISESIKANAESNPCTRDGMNLGEFPPLGNIIVSHTWSEARDAMSIRTEPPSSLSAELPGRESWILNRSGPHWARGSESLLKRIEGITEVESRHSVQSVLDAIIAHIEKINKIRAVLRDADQLFIAV